MIRLPIVGSSGHYELAPSKIIAVGLNYREHVAESPSILAARAAGRDRDGAPGAAPELPARPVLFVKTPNVLVGAGEPIVIPRRFLAEEEGLAAPRTDYEAELAVVVGRRCRDLSPAEALACVLGYTCFNDVSQRDVQNADRSGWWRGKSFDGFGPVGPALLPAALCPDPQELTIECRLNGRVVQRSGAAAMIFTVAEILSYISRNLTLEPGDLVATGTPSGVGPLADGDLVEVEIGGIGVLANPVREA
ncbi:MAG: fumarylacetoacetate hydrolase family protein [Spirochaetaceae bacterium]|nr:fumarylacetoacetate hydrolase family protein [Spirochaetaceae bacterium]